MIYLRDTDGMRTVWVPGASGSQPASVTLTLHSTTGLEDITVEAANTGEGGFFRLAVDPSALGLTPGEWEYTVGREGETLASGVLAVLSDELDYRKIYEKNITYEQYRAE